MDLTHVSAAQQKFDQDNEIEEAFAMKEFFQNEWKKLKALAKDGNVERMLEDYTPIAIVKLMAIADSSKSEAVRLDATKELLHMSMGKPIQRNINLNKNIKDIPIKELDALLNSKLKKLPPETKRAIIKVIEVKK